MRTHIADFTRLDEDETDVKVHYTYRPGSPAHYGSATYPGHPAEGPEIEVVAAYLGTEPVALTPVEESKFIDWISENHEVVDDREWERD